MKGNLICSGENDAESCATLANAQTHRMLFPSRRVSTKPLKLLAEPPPLAYTCGFSRAHCESKRFRRMLSKRVPRSHVRVCCGYGRRLVSFTSPITPDGRHRGSTWWRATFTLSLCFRHRPGCGCAGRESDTLFHPRRGAECQSRPRYPSCRGRPSSSCR